MDVPAELKQALHEAPFEALTELWSAFEEEFGAEGQRWLARNDRYYLLICILHQKHMIHPWIYARCREVEAAPDGYIDLWSREHFKALATAEEVLTTKGWKLHGDLSVGDEVFGPDGQPTRVVARTEIFENADCWRITFDDDSSIVASGDHLWEVEVRSRKRTPTGREGLVKRVVDTREMSQHNHRDNDRWSIAVPKALQFPEVDLPINPYVLGCWLGDGSTNAPRFVFSVEDAPHFESEFKKAGHVVRHYGKPSETVVHMALDPRDHRGVCTRGHERTPESTYRGACRKCKADYQRGTQPPPIVNTLAWRLRQCGLMNDGNKKNSKNRKHIPAVYMTASKDQRLSLLQGLMDTDGSCDTRGTATFSNTNLELTEQFFDLAQSLGLKPNLRVVNTTYKNEPYVFWSVSFQAHTNDAPFRLPRKLGRCKTGDKGRSAKRFIKSVAAVPTVPVSCIQVDRADGLYLAGRALLTTHNSSIITYAGVIQEVLKDPNITIAILSHTKPVAKKFLRQIQQEFEGNDRLMKLFPEIFYLKPEKDAPCWSLDAGLVVKRQSNPKECTIEAHGLVDGQPIGAHFSLLVYDDVVVPSSVSTPEQVQKTTEAWELSDNLGSASGGTRKWHIGTRYSYGDSYASIMERKAAIPRIYPATDDGTLTGHPVLWTQEVFDEKVKQQGDAVASCQLLQNPLAGKQKMFNVEDIGTYEIRPSILNVYIMVDPARSKKKGSANTAMVVLGIDYAMNKYLLDGHDMKMDLMQRWQFMAGLYEKWKRASGVQNIYVGYEKYGAQSDMDYFEEQMRVTRNRFTIIELEWPREGEGSKNDRIQRLGPDFRNHKFFTPYDTNEKALTAAQTKVKQQGYGFRIAQPIRRKDETNRIYDLSRHFRMQADFFPYGGRVDVLDAASRVYDMDPKAPSFSEPSYAEPEWT